MSDPVNAIRSFIDGDNMQAWFVAIALVVATAIVSHIVTKLIRRLMQVDGLPVPASSILVNVARSAIWIVGLSIMLSACFNVDVNALLAALGIGGVALSLGLQDTIKNFLGGLQITLLGIVHPGDHIIVGNVEGIVRDVSWRQTTVKDFENVLHLIPNAVINSTTVSKVEPDLLVSTMVSFTNEGRDLDALIREMELLAKSAVEEVAELEKDPWILMTQIGEYGMWGKMRFVLKDVAHAREARDAALRAIAPYTRLEPEKVLLDDGSDD